MKEIIFQIPDEWIRPKAVAMPVEHLRSSQSWPRVTLSNKIPATRESKPNFCPRCGLELTAVTGGCQCDRCGMFLNWNGKHRLSKKPKRWKGIALSLLVAALVLGAVVQPAIIIPIVVIVGAGLIMFFIMAIALGGM